MIRRNELISRVTLTSVAAGLIYLDYRCVRAVFHWAQHDGGFDQSGAKYPLIAAIVLTVLAVPCAAVALCGSDWLASRTTLERQTRLGESPRQGWIVNLITWIDWFC